jgi:hypothetical protein
LIISKFLRTRDHKYKLYKTHSRLDVRKYSFIHGTVETWNNLPFSVVTAPIIRSFEGGMGKFWESQPQKCD